MLFLPKVMVLVLSCFSIILFIVDAAKTRLHCCLCSSISIFCTYDVMWFVEAITVISVIISVTLKLTVGPCNHEQVLAKFVPVLPAYYVHFLVYLL